MGSGSVCEVPSGTLEVPLGEPCRQAVESVLARARALVPECTLPAAAPSDTGTARRLLRDIRQAASYRVRAAADRPGTAGPLLGLALLVDEAWAALEQIRDVIPNCAPVPSMGWVHGLRGARDVDDLLDRTGPVLHALGFPRVGISFIADGRWTMQRAYIEDDRGLAGRVCGLSARDPQRLTRETFEGRVASCRRGLLVDNVHSQQDRTHGAIVRELGTTAVLMLPLALGETTVGLLHVDVSDRTPTALPGYVRATANFVAVYSVLLEAVRLKEAIARFQANLAFPGVTPAPPARRADSSSELTAREAEILELLSQGMTNEEIARTLVLAPATVKTHVKHLLRKLGVSNRAAAVAHHLRRIH